MKKILLTGAGGAATTNFVRSLRLASERFFLVGVDCDKYSLQRAETDKKHLIPTCSDSDYIPCLNDIIKEYDIHLLFAQPDVEIAVISSERKNVETRVFLPGDDIIKICQDKVSSYQKWRNAGIKVPQTMLIRNEGDLQKAWSELQQKNGKIWIREISGAFGKGSLPATNYDMAKKWIDFKDGWGKYSAAECLEEQSVTWQSLWKNGELVVAQGRKRLYWEFANRSPSGVTGLTGTGITYSDATLDEIALKSILTIDSQPHGIYSVDLTYDLEKVPNPTEINIGRFFTTHYFFSKAGLNMPYLYVKLALGEETILPLKKMNPLPDNLAWIRGMDVEPKLTTLDEINKYEWELYERRKR